jgi:hypothetical protein
MGSFNNAGAAGVNPTRRSDSIAGHLGVVPPSVVVRKAEV